MPRGGGRGGFGHHHHHHGPGFRHGFIGPSPVVRAVRRVVHPRPVVVPLLRPIVLAPAPIIVPIGAPIIRPSTPITTPIQGGYHAGKIIYISGNPRPGANRFTINLACGPSDGAELAFHLDVRFNYAGDYNVVVRNHRYGDSFGQEEKDQSYFPFIQGVNFELMILAEPEQIKVAVNNQHFLEFQHRIQPLESISHLQIRGDVNVHQIRFQ